MLAILQDPALKQPGKTEERRQKIRAIANEVFDWQETGKRALARHWQGRSPQEREEFSKLFADLLERSYVGKIEAYSGEKILYGEETLDGDQADGADQARDQDRDPDPDRLPDAEGRATAGASTT